MRSLRFPALTVVGLLLAGCGAADGPADAVGEPRSCTPVPAAALVPADGVLVGAHLDWAPASLWDYASTLGQRPAVAGAFTAVPSTSTELAGVDAVVDQLADVGGLLLLTMEPRTGLAEVDDDVARDVALRLDAYNRRGVPVVVRFGPEMNGHWYPWGQQPTEYVAAFRRLAAAVHAHAPGSATMWAPAYGGGYPFVADSPTADVAVLDVDGDGSITRADDPYAPYWPGADAVDWVGLSLFHWGDRWPWGDNEVPEPGKLVAQLTGEYVGAGGDDRALPDFYAVYGEGYDKPVAIPETAALWAPGGGGDPERSVKQAWWRQVLAPSLASRFPRLAMITWVERALPAAEGLPAVDWRVLAAGDLADAFRGDLPGWARWAGDVPGCDGTRP